MKPPAPARQAKCTQDQRQEPRQLQQQQQQQQQQRLPSSTVVEGDNETTKSSSSLLVWFPFLWALWMKISQILSVVTVEPIMMIDGLSYSIIIVFVENLQMEKICRVNLNLTEEVCENISQYPEENIKLQQSFSVFGMYNGIIMAFIPLFFILFMGAWSDKYGRKVPLMIATLGHFFWAAGYLLNSWMTHWPVEYLLVAALVDSLGGGNISFITASNAYISDVTSEQARTSRVGLANSIWYLGGPIGTLVGTYIYKYGGNRVLFGTSVCMYVISITYQTLILKESHGPFAAHKLALTTDNQEEQEQEQQHQQQLQQQQQEQQQLPSVRLSMKKESDLPENGNIISIWTMLKDFFNHERIVDSFRCTFKARGGLVRVFILLLILCNLLRRLGRGAYMYLFTRRVLRWRATDYGLWVTYKNLMAALGSLVAVPLLSTGLGVSDNYLAMLGAIASVADYTLYGLVSEETYALVWVAPCVAVLVNSCMIAIRSMLSKFVTGDELGKVSAVMGALDGVMPMLSFSLYTAVYHATVHVFPGAQFFFGASSNLLMTIIFLFIIVSTTSRSYNIDDLNSGEVETGVKPLSLKFESDHLSNNGLPSGPPPSKEASDMNAQRTAMVLSGINFHMGTPAMKPKKAKQKKSSSPCVIQNEGDRGLNANNEGDSVKKLSRKEKNMLVQELTYPQTMSPEKLIKSKKEEEEEEEEEDSSKCGIDNLAFCDVESEMVSDVSETPSSSRTDQVLIDQNLPEKNVSDEIHP